MSTAILGRGPQPYASPHHPNLHSGVVSVTGSLTVDLGIRHDNFVPSVSLNAGSAALQPAAGAQLVTWRRGTTAGTFIIEAWEISLAEAAPPVVSYVAATAAVKVSFTAIVGAKVEAGIP